MNPENPPFVAPSFSSSHLHALLNELLNAYESKGMNVSPSLLPPVAEAELRKQCAWFPGELPQEIVSLYGWRGGQETGAWESEHPFWFRDKSFSSLEIAQFEYESLMESYGSLPQDHEMLKYSFPFAAFNGGWYVLPTRTHHFQSRFERPVISVLEGIEVHFYSIETMVATCIDWVKHEDYDDSGSLPSEDERRIWEHYNPGMFEQT